MGERESGRGERDGRGRGRESISYKLHSVKSELVQELYQLCPARQNILTELQKYFACYIP